jgi:hypothetical protein
VNRFRFRFRVRSEALIVTVLELIDAPSSDEKLVDEDVRERDNRGRFVCIDWGRNASNLEMHLYGRLEVLNHSLIKFIFVVRPLRDIEK